MTETIKLADLTPDARNANKGTKRGGIAAVSGCVRD